MKSQHLASSVAKRVMGWGVGPARFLLGDRGWIVRRRFEPTKRIEDAFRLLEKAAPQCWTMGFDNGTFWVEVQIGGTTARACNDSKPLAISLAVAAAPKDLARPSSDPRHRRAVFSRALSV